MPKQTKVITRRRKFIPVEVPLVNLKAELIGTSTADIKNKTIKLDLTRQLKGKSVEGTFIVGIEKNKAVAYPSKIKLMPYFIRRMIRKRISYVEDSFETPTQESMVKIKPFLITRKRVSKAIRKTLRNKARNWLEDYLAEKKDDEIFNEILSNKLQKPLSLMLKKTYPLSLCEIRLLEIKRPLKLNEVPKIDKTKKTLEKPKKEIEEGLDQLKEIEEERIKKAELVIKKTQEKAAKKEKEDKETEKEEIEEIEEEVKEKSGKKNIDNKKVKDKENGN